MDSHVLITTAGELRGLHRDPRVNGLLMRRLVRVEIAALTTRESIGIERRLNRYQRRCGCVAAAICFLAAIVAGIFVGRDGLDSWSSSLRIVAASVGTAVIVAFTAKLIVLQITRWQFALACRRLSRVLGDSR